MVNTQTCQAKARARTRGNRLPNADNLASLLEAYRTACQTLESSTKQVAEL